MDAPSYEQKVPAHVKTQNAAKLAQYQAEIAEMEKQAKILAQFA